VLAPQEGIQHDPRGDATALVVDANGKVEQRKVDVSRAVGNRWVVDQGLAAGDRLIVSGLQKVQPGMSVQAVEAMPTATAYAASGSGTGAGPGAAAPVAR
jgi:membrane fusion protein (multidrug efflux system)